jgi:hypothetical protein
MRRPLPPLSLHEGGPPFASPQTISCNGDATKFFSYTIYDETSGSKGCRPFFKNGEQCDLSPYDNTYDLTYRNYGCAPGLACIRRMCTAAVPLMA